MIARIAMLPAVVVIVPASSASYRLSRQSTLVIVPCGSSVNQPIGRRARPYREPNSGRWSWTSLCYTLNLIALAPGSA